MFIIKKYFKVLINENIKHFKILAAGIILSQFINFISIFFITRLYSPEFFGNFAIFLGIVTICSTFVSGAYEIGIVTSRVRHEANTLLVLSFVFSFINSTLIFIIFFFYEIQIKNLLNANQLNFWWFFIPLLILLQSVILIIKSYANRYKFYYVISKILVTKSLFTGGIAIFFGLANLLSYGLFMSELLSTFIVVILFFLFDKKNIKKIIWNLNDKAFFILKKYKQFPIFIASGRFIDNLTLIVPIFFLNNYFNSEIVGYFSLCKLVFAPFVFIGSSISTLYLKRATEIANNKKKSISYFLKISIFLLAVIFFPSVVLFLFGPQIFILVFGNEWMLAGKFIQILIPSLALQFIVATLSPAISATLNSKLYALQTIVSLIFIFAFFLFFSTQLEITELLFYFNILNLFLYSLYYFLIYFCILHPKNKKEK